MLWHYQKDLSDYTFGQGGYYSPQQYLSLSVPISWRQRSAVSWSHAKTDARQHYPINPGFDLAANPASKGGSSSGIGYSLLGIIERRLTENRTTELALDIKQAKDYTPSHGLLYLRYAMAG